MSKPLQMPPADCPNDGMCMTMEPRINEAEKELQRHEAALTRIGKGLDEVKDSVHEIQVVLRERDNTVGFLKTVFLSLLGVGVLQFCTTIWWAASMTAQGSVISEKVADHEVRLRANEVFIRKQP